MADQVESKRIIEVIIGFDAVDEKIEYIKSDFTNETYAYKDPIGYTAKLIQMGLEKWVRDNIGVFCPECEAEMEENWKFCPNCGWSSDE